MPSSIDLRFPWQKAFDAWKAKNTVPENMEKAFQDVFLSAFIAGEHHAHETVERRFSDFVRGYRVDRP